MVSIRLFLSFVLAVALHTSCCQQVVGFTGTANKFAFSHADKTTPLEARNRPGEEDLPTLEPMKAYQAPKGVSPAQFYLPTYTLLRAGPVGFLRRLIDPKKYEQLVYKYMQDYKENSLMSAQGNADAFLASPGTKLFEDNGCALKFCSIHRSCNVHTLRGTLTPETAIIHHLIA